MQIQVFVRDKLDPVLSDPVPVAANVAQDTVKLKDGSVRNAQASLPSLVPLK